MTKAEEMRIKATGICLTKKERLEQTYANALAKINSYADNKHTNCIVDCDKDLRDELVSVLKKDGFNAYVYTGHSMAGIYKDVRVEW